MVAERSPVPAFEGRSARSPTDEAAWNSVKKDQGRENVMREEVKEQNISQMKSYLFGNQLQVQTKVLYNIYIY